MTFAIGSGCVDVRDRSCVAVCPVDCIYEGDRKLYINPDECIDCGACMTECPMNAVVRLEDVPDSERVIALDNEVFFTQVLPGRTEPIGSPGEAAPLGRIGVDTELVAALPVATP
ncbi:4Fe-4S dicluster domain-containing protein [Nocardioides marmoriginsengisoli]|uniref:Ferredoxin n=1 Tax=Nocardioides marmoriginsengisoli TaxID=661483 RepID=A0A3N0CF47_9ACTN|nr:ferredoxin [Nocardioides marmoriginsengisoli]RNL61909.1 4Fe-4S dicluster domain-containing protein [Nocardioides marmoriginsengisoli]